MVCIFLYVAHVFRQILLRNSNIITEYTEQFLKYSTNNLDASKSVKTLKIHSEKFVSLQRDWKSLKYMF